MEIVELVPLGGPAIRRPAIFSSSLNKMTSRATQGSKLNSESFSHHNEGSRNLSSFL